jgi:hypothetical protein
MDVGWAAVIGASIAAVVSVVTVFLSRAEPRALKELKALNEVIEASPKSSDARADLEGRRDRVAKRYAAEPASVEERSIPIMFMTGIGLSAVAFLVYLFAAAGNLPRNAPTLIALLLGTLGTSLVVLSLLLLAGMILGYVVPALYAIARRKWSKRRAHRVPDSDLTPTELGSGVISASD